jgi:hypothetical protein
LKRGSVKDLDIAQEILAYLLEHPHAQDTLEGIVQWWLLEREILRSADKVQSALAELKTLGMLLEREGRDLRIHYRINRRKSAAIRALLNQGAE